eukprot:g4616.t1
MRESFASGKTRSIEWRRKQLLAMKKMMVKERRVLEQFLWKDLHKSAFEAYIYELNPVMHEIQQCLDHLEEWSAPEKTPTNLLNIPGESLIYKDPLGVILVAGAWNYPINLTFSPLVGAIAAGNCVMVKVPSSKYSSNSAAGMAKMIAKYLDPSCIKVIEGDRHAMNAVL